MRLDHRIKFNAFVLITMLGSAMFTVVPQIATADDETQDPVDILVLVDESASLSSAAVRAEKAALKEIIASDELEGRGIRVGVLPFSSGADSPRIVRDCELSFIGGDNDGRASLNTCADQIVRQRKRGSADTDFSSAISTALETFDRSDATKVILLLTDGKYDPDGNESISIDEQSQLDEVLAQANSKQVSMWALGFGKADKKALSDYVGMTSPGDETCPTRPEAVLVTEVDLAVELRRIIDHATCTGRETGQADPDFEFPVSPLISQLLIEVSDRRAPVRLADVEVLNADGEEVCGDALSQDGRWKCRVAIGGGDGGEWKVTSTRSSRVLDVLVTWTGAIEVMAADCVVGETGVPETVVKVFRADKDPVDFGVEGDIKWPKVMVDISKDSTRIRTVELDLDAEEKEILGIEEAPLGSDINISLARESADERLVVRTTQISNCALTSAVVPTTTASTDPSTSTAAPSTPTTIGDPPPPPPPWWIIAVAVAALGAALFLWRRRKAATFPDGSELARQNSVNKSVYEGLDIAGKRKVYFDVVSGNIGGAIEILDGKRGARYLLVREDSSSVRITSLHVEEKDEERDESDDLEESDIDSSAESHDDRESLVVVNNEPFNVRESDPTGAPGKEHPFMMKVIVPEDIDEGDIE